MPLSEGGAAAAGACAAPCGAALPETGAVAADACAIPCGAVFLRELGGRVPLPETGGVLWEDCTVS